MRGAQPRLDVETQLVGDHEDRLSKSRAECIGHDAGASFFGFLAEEHPVAHDVGRAVGADVGELLGAHMCDRAGQGRDHEREPFGDPARMNAGAMQCDPGPLGDGVDPSAFIGRRVEPAERSDDVLARLQDRGHDLGVGDERAVQDAVGVGGQERVDVTRRGHSDAVATDELADVDTVFGGAVHPGADQFEIGMCEHPGDRGATHSARGPLDYTVAHGRHDAISAEIAACSAGRAKFLPDSEVRLIFVCDPARTSEQRTQHGLAGRTANECRRPGRSPGAGPRGADAVAADAGRLFRDLADDELLDEFWRRRSSIGHC